MTTQNTKHPITFYRVGGCIRDKLMGRTPNDVDYVVEDVSYNDMKAYLLKQFTLVYEKPEFLTIRVKPNSSGFATASTTQQKTPCLDFVMARKDGIYHDKRHPETVTPGTISDDLSRRDFTCNAIAQMHKFDSKDSDSCYWIHTMVKRTSKTNICVASKVQAHDLKKMRYASCVLFDS